MHLQHSASEGTAGSDSQSKCTALTTSHKDSPKRKLYSLLAIVYQGKVRLSTAGINTRLGTHGKKNKAAHHRWILSLNRNVLWTYLTEVLGAKASLGARDVCWQKKSNATGVAVESY